MPEPHYFYLEFQFAHNPYFIIVRLHFLICKMRIIMIIYRTHRCGEDEIGLGYKALSTAPTIYVTSFQ